jgi:hypothetical protein
MYKKISNERGLVENVIKRLSDGAFLFADATSTDYQAYLKWLEDGNTPTPADEEPSA